MRFWEKYSSRWRIKKKIRLFRVTSSSQSFSSGFSTTKFSDNRSVCFPPMPSTTSIYGLASRSLESGDRCNDTKLEHRSSLSISPFQYDFKSAPKNKAGMCSSSDSNCTSLEYPTMVLRSFKPMCQGTSAAAPGTRDSDKPKKYCPPIDGGEVNDTSGFVGFRKTLLCEGISENTSHIITNSRRKGTLSNYESAWRKWSSWCFKRKIDPFQAPVKDIIECLTFLFNYGNEYRTINLHWSAISAFHEYIDGLPVEKHPWICSLVSVVYNLKPPKPRYMFVFS